MKGYCGANCDECELYNKKCKGCIETKGCPFGKKCWIADYIEIGGMDNFESFKKELINEFNSLQIEGMPTIKELYTLHGSYVNLEYKLPNGKNVKLLNDKNKIVFGKLYENVEVLAVKDDAGNTGYALIGSGTGRLLEGSWSREVTKNPSEVEDDYKENKTTNVTDKNTTKKNSTK